MEETNTESHEIYGTFCIDFLHSVYCMLRHWYSPFPTKEMVVEISLTKVNHNILHMIALLWGHDTMHNATVDSSHLYPTCSDMCCLHPYILVMSVGDWVSWTVRTKVMTDVEMLAIRNMLTEASMDR